MAGSAYDCVVIGGGPAGLTAAIYLARFRLSVAVLEDGRSRAALIPLTRNLAGHPDGIAGPELLHRMRAHAEAFGVRLLHGHADELAQDDQALKVAFGGTELRAEKVLLATGVHNFTPDIPQSLHDQALARGCLRYCPVCDGFEVSDRRVAILGTGDHALREAQFLRSFSPEVTLVSSYGPHAFTVQQEKQLEDWNIMAVDGPVTGISLEGRGICLTTGSQTLGFDTLYAALGTVVRSELARAAGAQTAGDGSVLVDRHQMTSIDGLYAAGDVVKGLDQIASAMGQASIAATAMRNAICERRPLRRGP